MKQFKIFLLATMLMLFATVSNANTVNMAPIITYLLSDTVTPQSEAIDKIMLYADDNTQPVPTIQDYEDAGVVGVTAENIDDVNSAVNMLTASDVDTTEEIQGIVDNLGVNNPPVAHAGVDRDVARYSKVHLDGSGSYDPEGAAITFHWTLQKPNGSNAVLSDATDALPTFIADINGEYHIELIVNDGIQDSSPVNIIITASTQYWKIDGQNIVPTYEEQIPEVPAVPTL